MHQLRYLLAYANAADPSFDAGCWGLRASSWVLGVRVRVVCRILLVPALSPSHLYTQIVLLIAK